METSDVLSPALDPSPGGERPRGQASVLLARRSLARLAALVDPTDLPDVDAALLRIAGTAVEVCGGVAASVVVPDGAGGSTLVATSPLVHTLEDLQQHGVAGPGRDAVAGQVTVSSTDLPSDVRWPRYGSFAAAADVGSVLAVPVAISGAVGCLSVFRERSRSWSEDDQRLVEVVAEVAGPAARAASAWFASRTLAEQLQVAMASRSVIDQAAGIVMVRRDLGASEAMAVLVRESNDSNTKLRVLAQAVVAGSAAVPPSPRPRRAQPAGRSRGGGR